MKVALLILFAVTSLSTFTFGQKTGKNEANFSDPFQMDSSEYFLIPKIVDSDDQLVYGKGKGYLLWGHYSDIVFYNSKTNKSKNLFNGQLALITPFHTRRSFNIPDKEPETPANFLPNQIVYLVRTDNFSGDNALDSDDPIYLYISTRTGDNLRQITPKNFNVLSWTVSKDKKMILVKGQNDKNGNKRFGDGDDQLIYRIDLNDDIAKIQCYQIGI